MRSLHHNEVMTLTHDVIIILDGGTTGYCVCLLSGVLRGFLIPGQKTWLCFLARGTAWENYHNCWLTVKQDQSVHRTSLGPPGSPAQSRGEKLSSAVYLLPLRDKLSLHSPSNAHASYWAPYNMGLQPLYWPGGQCPVYHIHFKPLQQQPVLYLRSIYDNLFFTKDFSFVISFQKNKKKKRRKFLTIVKRVKQAPTNIVFRNVQFQ